MASPAEVSDDLRQVLQEPRPIEVVVEDRQSPNAAAAHVIRRSGLDDEGAWSLHAVRITERPPLSSVRPADLARSCDILDTSRVQDSGHARNSEAHESSG